MKKLLVLLALTVGLAACDDSAEREAKAAAEKAKVEARGQG